MKNLKFLLFTLFISLILINNVFAICNETIINEANSVKIDKKVMTNTEEDELYFQIQVGPISENLYVNITETSDNTSTNYYYKDTENGILKLNSYYLYEKIKYTAKIYSFNNECKDELLKTISVETPKYNEYYYSDECKKLPVPQYCDIFADTSNISKKEFLRIMNEYDTMLNSTSKSKFVVFISKYYLYIVIPVAIVSLIYTLKIIKLKRNIKK